MRMFIANEHITTNEHHTGLLIVSLYCVGDRHIVESPIIVGGETPGISGGNCYFTMYSK
jgi:hypothetical protein